MIFGCLLAAISYMPIYQAMQRAAGSNVVTTVSKPNRVTGAISLIPPKPETSTLVCIIRSS